jgi:hypothetical protein
MPGYVSPTVRIPPAWQSSAGEPRARPQSVDPQPAAPAQASQSQHNQIAIHQILLSAANLIASVTGVKAHEVSVSVNIGRYEF